MAGGYRYMSLRAHWHAVVNAAKRLPPKLRWLMAVLAGFFLADVIGLIVLFRRGRDHDTLEFELAKAMLQFDFQFVAVAVIGTLVFEYQRRSRNLDKEDERERKKLIRREEFLRSTLTRATEAYSNVKKTRRLLRARAIVGEETGGKVALTKQYDLHLEMINDAQLELENLARDIKTSEQTFSDPAALRVALSEMESILSASS